MEYMLLIYWSEAEARNRSEAEMGRMHQDYMSFTQDLVRQGKNKGGNGLERTASANTVQVRDGKTMVTDGPFAETKEQLGGYYLVEAKDLDEAISLAARIPGAKFGAVEVRPVMKIPM
jgi:hypothetical protein